MVSVYANLVNEGPKVTGRSSPAHKDQTENITYRGGDWIEFRLNFNRKVIVSGDRRAVVNVQNHRVSGFETTRIEIGILPIIQALEPKGFCFATR